MFLKVLAEFIVTTLLMKAEEHGKVLTIFLLFDW